MGTISATEQTETARAFRGRDAKRGRCLAARQDQHVLDLVWDPTLTLCPQLTLGALAPLAVVAAPEEEEEEEEMRRVKECVKEKEDCSVLGLTFPSCWRKRERTAATAAGNAPRSVTFRRVPHLALSTRTLATTATATATTLATTVAVTTAAAATDFGEEAKEGTSGRPAFSETTSLFVLLQRVALALTTVLVIIVLVVVVVVVVVVLRALGLTTMKTVTVTVTVTVIQTSSHAVGMGTVSSAVEVFQAVVMAAACPAGWVWD